MNAFINTAPIIAGVYLLWITTMWTTHTAIAGMVYKVGPFLAGCASIIAGLKLWGVL